MAGLGYACYDFDSIKLPNYEPTNDDALAIAIFDQDSDGVQDVLVYSDHATNKLNVRLGDTGAEYWTTATLGGSLGLSPDAMFGRSAYVNANRTSILSTLGSGGVLLSATGSDSINGIPIVDFAIPTTPGGVTAIAKTASPITFFADLTGDFIVETIVYRQSSGALEAYFSKPTTGIGTTAIQLDHDSPFSGYFGFYNGSVCVNSTFTISARECNAGIPNCNYFNTFSVTDRERLSSTCDDQYSELINGSFNAFNPSITCPTNVTGTYDVTVYIQSEDEITNQGLVLFNEFNSEEISYTVVNGVEAVSYTHLRACLLYTSPSPRDRS